MAGFVWRVAVKGYVWRGFLPPGFAPGLHDFSGEHRPSDEWKALVPVEWVFRSYEPLKEHSGLFRTFAATPATFEGIQAFATKYGHLGEGGYGTWSPSKGEQFQDDEDRAMYGQAKDHYSIPQPFKEWETAILRMRRALDLLDSVRNRRGVEKDIREIQEIIDGQLSNLRVVPRFEFKKSPSHEPALHLVPNTLGGAMWIQLAQAIAGDKKHRACESCGRWFELSPETARTSKYYCTEACRSRAYRARKEYAHQLHSEGKTPIQIAEQLKSEVETIKKWLIE
jgi:hypothetical protein